MKLYIINTKYKHSFNPLTAREGGGPPKNVCKSVDVYMCVYVYPLVRDETMGWYFIQVLFWWRVLFTEPFLC